MGKLTEKQELFCRNIALKNMKQSEAYLNAYNANNMGKNTLYVKSCRLMKQDKIRLRVEKLRERLINLSLWDKIDSINELRLIAMNGSYEQSFKAIEELNRILGYKKNV